MFGWAASARRRTISAAVSPVAASCIQQLRVEGQNGTQVWNMRGELLFSLK